MSVKKIGRRMAMTIVLGVLLGTFPPQNAWAALVFKDDPTSKNVVNVRDFGAVGDGSAALASADFIRQHGQLDDRLNPLVPDVRYRAGWDSKDFGGIQSALDYAGKADKRSAWSEGLSNSIQVKGNVIRGVTSGGIYLTATKAGKPQPSVFSATCSTARQTALNFPARFRARCSRTTALPTRRARASWWKRPCVPNS